MLDRRSIFIGYRHIKFEAQQKTSTIDMAAVNMTAETLSDRIVHNLALLVNAVIRLEERMEEEELAKNEHPHARARRILAANLEMMKEVSIYSAAELEEILNRMEQQRHERAKDFLCERLGLKEYGLIANHPDRGYTVWSRMF